MHAKLRRTFRGGNTGLAECLRLENSVEFATEAEGYSEHKECIVNGSSYQGYLFRCLNCKKYILYVDCD
ncbi:MAG: CbrC family protein [Bacteroides sp.]